MLPPPLAAASMPAPLGSISFQTSAHAGWDAPQAGHERRKYLQIGAAVRSSTNLDNAREDVITPGSMKIDWIKHSRNWLVENL